MSGFWASVIAPALLIAALCAGIAGALVGAGLLLRRGPTLAFMRTMNRWVSSRRALRPLEVPRPLEAPVRSQRLWLGLLIAGAGAYVLIVLVWSFGTAQVLAALGPAGRGPLAPVLVETARWCLVAGSALAAVVGLMMAFAPEALEALEARSDRWISTRQAFQGADAQYLALDRLVEAYPAASGAILLALSLAGCAASLVLLLAR